MKKTIFYNTDPVAISTRLNEYMKSNFGYSVESDLESLREAKATLEAKKREMTTNHQDREYVETMLMIETIKSLLKAHVAEVAEGKLPPALQAYQDKKNGKKKDDKKEEEQVDEGTKGCGDCEWIKDETDGDIDTCDECAAEKRQKANEAEERPYVCVHAKKGKHECTAASSYEAAQKAAKAWGLKSTAGIDAHLADKEKVATEGKYKSDAQRKAVHASKAEKANEIAPAVAAVAGGVARAAMSKGIKGAATRGAIKGALSRNDEAETETRYAVIKYPDTSISYAKNDGAGWEHMYDKSYGYEGPVDKEDFKHGKIIDASKVPSRLLKESEDVVEGDKPKFETMKQYDNAYKAPKEVKMKKEKIEEGLLAELNALLEADAADAEITMAARGIVDELQDMIEKLGKIQNDQLGPLADEMAYSHGPEQSAAFKDATDSAIASLLGTARATKDSVNDAVLVLTGQQPAADMAASDAELGGDMGADMEDDISADMDLTGGDESMAGPEDEPLGRAKR